MEVYRIVRAEYADRLSTSGKPNRWNLKGQHVIYTGSSRALSTLEQLVHLGSIYPSHTYRVMVISLPDHDYFHRQVDISELPADWRSISAYATLQRLGAAWVDSCGSLVLKVPSAVVPMEYNMLINTAHPDFIEQVRLVRTEDYFWDERWIR
jgi:RES domain-containing protein